jgi:hypothetical protein
MTNTIILKKFFDERIKNSKQKPLLLKLKNIAISRATGRISEEKALFNINKIMGYKIEPLFNQGLFNQSKKFNPLVGVKTKQKKQKAVLEGLFEYNKNPHKPQFPILGLQPIKSNSNKKRFVVTPAKKAWFDISDFSNPNKKNSFKSHLAKTRINDSNKAMKQILDAVNNSNKVNQKPVFKLNFKQPKLNKFKTKKKSKGKQNQSIAGMMGF